MLQTREDVERSLGEYARAVIERDALTAEMEQRIRQIRAEYETRLAVLARAADAEFDLLAEWADRHPEEFSGRRSLELTHGVIGFRTGTPKLKTLRGVTWERVLERMTLRDLQRYIRQKMEVARDLLIADRDVLGEAMLREIGVTVAQDETFFVEVRREVAPDPAVAETEER